MAGLLSINVDAWSFTSRKRRLSDYMASLQRLFAHDFIQYVDVSPGTATSEDVPQTYEPPPVLSTATQHLLTLQDSHDLVIVGRQLAGKRYWNALRCEASWLDWYDQSQGLFWCDEISTVLENMHERWRVDRDVKLKLDRVYQLRDLHRYRRVVNKLSKFDVIVNGHWTAPKSERMKTCPSFVSNLISANIPPKEHPVDIWPNEDKPIKAASAPYTFKRAKRAFKSVQLAKQFVSPDTVIVGKRFAGKKTWPELEKEVSAMPLHERNIHAQLFSMQFRPRLQTALYEEPVLAPWDAIGRLSRYLVDIRHQESTMTIYGDLVTEMRILTAAKRDADRLYHLGNANRVRRVLQRRLSFDVPLTVHWTQPKYTRMKLYTSSLDELQFDDAVYVQAPYRFVLAESHIDDWCDQTQLFAGMDYRKAAGEQKHSLVTKWRAKLKDARRKENKGRRTR